MRGLPSIRIYREVVGRVLELEFEYMVGVGIADVADYEFQYYRRDQLAGSPPVVDTDLLANDAERLLGVPSEVAAKIFDSESEFLRMRGLIG